LKLDVRNESALASPTPETALQDIAALVLASAVLARLRVEAAVHMKVPPQRMSFYKIKLATRPLWDTYEIVGDTLTEAQRLQAWQRYTDFRDPLQKLLGITPRQSSIATERPWALSSHIACGLPADHFNIVLTASFRSCSAPAQTSRTFTCPARP
jgi:hypothetical protein